ncbi:MAG TPA: DUF2867 domain-containing protein [Solirubrobacteraceae bacterium]|jgi:hypothetical protein
MRLPNSEHTSRPWRIHQIARDFRLEDVWRMPGKGGPDDLPRAVELLSRFDPARSSSAVVRTLFAVRWKVGQLLGWDDEGSGVGARVPTLRDRMPADLRAAPRGPELPALPFTPLYLLQDEFAAEVANETMHGVVHLGWVPGADGRYSAQMAVLVKPNGLRGQAYMAAIRPFRHLLVYPALLQDGEREWEALAARA